MTSGIASIIASIIRSGIADNRLCQLTSSVRAVFAGIPSPDNPHQPRRTPRLLRPNHGQARPLALACKAGGCGVLAYTHRVSYDIYFWRQDGSVQDSPEELLDKLMSEGPVAGVVEIDADALGRNIIAALPAFVVEESTPAQTMLQRETGGAFDIQWYPQCVSVSAHRPIDGDDWNAIIDVMNGAGLAVYDAQLAERFYQPDPTALAASGDLGLLSRFTRLFRRRK